MMMMMMMMMPVIAPVVLGYTYEAHRPNINVNFISPTGSTAQYTKYMYHVEEQTDAPT